MKNKELLAAARFVLEKASADPEHCGHPQLIAVLEDEEATINTLQFLARAKVELEEFIDPKERKALQASFCCVIQSLACMHAGLKVKGREN